MSGLIQFRLATLAARRTAGVFVVLWITIVLAIAANTRPENATHFGLARQHVWACFLLGVAPLLVLRAIARTAPMHAGDAAWLATRRASNTTISLSTWAGVFVAWCLAACTFAVVLEIGPPAKNQLLVACGTCEVPTGQWFSTDAPLAWRATVPGDAQSATFEIGLGAANGSVGTVTPRARSAERDDFLVGNAVRLGGRGEIEVAIRRPEVEKGVRPPEAAPAVDFELHCAGEGTRALILSPQGTLWTRATSPFSASVNIALRLVLAGAAWSALALAFACFVGSTTAACSVLALWIPVWMSDWPLSTTRWIPGADLFEALAIVGTGRAPAAPTVHAWIGTLAIVAFAIVLQAFGLSRWRVSR